jgi:hypothetical protein
VDQPVVDQPVASQSGAERPGAAPSRHARTRLASASLAPTDPTQATATQPDAVPVSTMPINTIPVSAVQIDSALRTAAQAVAALFRAGLELSSAEAEALRQATGEADPARALAALEAGADSCETAPLLALIYSPGPAAMRALEPALAAADLDADGAERLGREAARLVLAAPAVALFPEGTAAGLAPRADDVRDYVRRLRPAATPPPELRILLARRFAPGDAAALAVTLRHGRLVWTPARLFFLATLLERVDPAAAAGGLDAAALTAWSVGFLDLTGENFDPRAALAERRRALVAQLRQAEFAEQAQERGSFEVRMSQGMRLGHVHGPDVRAGLALLDRACRLVLGLAGEDLDGVAERDLGRAEGPEDLLRLLRGAPLE